MVLWPLLLIQRQSLSPHQRQQIIKRDLAQIDGLLEVPRTMEESDNIVRQQMVEEQERKRQRMIDDAAAASAAIAPTSRPPRWYDVEVSTPLLIICLFI